MNRSIRVLVVLFFVSMSSAAFAGPGALEISETCAVHTGCFTGDTAGYPVTITSATPGSSFVLTSDLALPDENTHGIEITKDFVSVDLAGFTIRGVTTCSGIPVSSCSPTGSGKGISAGTQSGIEIKNGNVTNIGSRCIEILAGSIKNLRVSQCASVGIQVNGRAVIRDTMVDFAISGGISVGNSSSLEGVVSAFNGSDGFDLGIGSSLVNATTYQNNGHGIVTFDGSTIQDCSTYINELRGINATGSVTIRGNSVHGNQEQGIGLFGFGSSVLGNTVSNNGDGETDDHGIFCSTSACNIQDNMIRDNDGYGIFANDATTGYGGNVTHSNTQGAVSGGTDLGGNLLN